MILSVRPVFEAGLRIHSATVAVTSSSNQPTAYAVSSSFDTSMGSKTLK